LSILPGKEPSTRAKKVPDWVPVLVVSVENAMRPFSQEIGERLLTNPHMQQVWGTLITEGGKRALDDPDGFEGRLNSLPERYRAETYPSTLPGTDPETEWLSMMLADGNVPADELDRADALYRRTRHAAYLADNACASFFLATVIIFTLGNPSVKEHDIEREMSRWQEGAKLCREALSSPHRATVDPALAAALSMSADYFEGLATSIERSAAGSPYLIGRGARKKGVLRRNEYIRGQVCDLARITHKIFGSFLHVPIATAASVVTGQSISPKSVENWSKAAPSKGIST
jgi:hypothetical protein